MFLHVEKAEYIADHKVHLWFNDGSDGEADLSHSLNGPVFSPLRDLDYFKSFRLEGHTLSWPNGADFAPEYLHNLMKSSLSVKH